ncbi:methylamine utilization [Synechococcus virus S-PRM1]|uniref:Sm-like domain-containing protein n=1 Tax=Synechococcus virus S-PRM1 TaxID=2100130 RepID=A0A346FKL6_9CAUD|nr:methylamine utilization [Synechococcus virus S-PRM1]AXN58521.1 hypothetical protein [Synechococcus virus S-PRM1]
MKETFAIIKLVSGEEVFAQVEEFYDEEAKALLLIDPCVMKEIPSRRSGQSFFKVDAWMKLADDSIYCLELKHVMCYQRCNDPDIIKTYRKWTRAINNEPEETVKSKVGVSTSMGYVSSVETTRESLEKLYKNS